VKYNNSIKKNFVMNALLTMSSFIFPLITFPYVSRILLPIGTGKVSFSTSLIAYFNMFAQLGIPTYGIRACAKVRDNREELTRTAHELLFINLVTSMISYTVLIISLIFVPRLHEDRTLYIVTSCTIFLTSIGMEWLYKGLEQYTYITIRSIVFKFIGVVGMFFLVNRQEDYVIYGGITIFAASASNIFNFINAHKYIDMRWLGNYHPEKHLKAVAIFFAMACATTIYTRLDMVMLGFMASDAEVGYYNAAVRIKTIMVSIVTSLGTVLFPRASYYIEHKEYAEFKKISQKALNFVVLLAMPLMLYFILFAKEGVLLLAGKAYLDAVLPMQIIMPTLLFIGLNSITGIQMLVPLGMEKVVMHSQIAGAIVDMAINVLLIPHYGAAGAAFGTLVAELVVLTWQYVALRKQLTDVFRQIKYCSILTALVLAGVIAIGTKYLNVGIFFTLCISGVLFFGVYGATLLAVKEPLTLQIVDQSIGKIKKYIWSILRRTNEETSD